MKVAMTIAGSDSSAGAGIQADLKTFAANSVYGVSVITSVTAQNTMGVDAVFDIPVDIIEKQFLSIISDIQVDSVKIGMLSNKNIINSVSTLITSNHIKNLILDPVMVAKGGARLLNEDAVKLLTNKLIPLSYLVTPNTDEAEVLSGIPINNLDDAIKSAKVIKNFGAENVLIKGGHLKGEYASDIFFDGNEIFEFTEKRTLSKNTHGTGCTLASAIAANVAKGLELKSAIEKSKKYVTGAITASVDMGIGHGHGPLNHFYGCF